MTRVMATARRTHLKDVFAEGELGEEATCKDCLQARPEELEGAER